MCITYTGRSFITLSPLILNFSTFYVITEIKEENLKWVKALSALSIIFQFNSQLIRYYNLSTVYIFRLSSLCYTEVKIV